MKSFLASAIVAVVFANEEAAAEEPARDASYAAASTAYAASTSDTCEADVEGVVGNLDRRADQPTKDAHAAATSSETEICTCFASANADEDEASKATATAACACSAGETESCTGATAIATGAALFAIAALLQ